jgi:hypothetical protein
MTWFLTHPPLYCCLQALLALASKHQGMDALLQSPPTLQRLVATLQMAHTDTSLPKLALQVGLQTGMSLLSTTQALVLLLVTALTDATGLLCYKACTFAAW